jgi:hypothetical protein
MTFRKACCLCGREGHRSRDCPMRDPCKPFASQGAGVAIWFGLGALFEVVAFAIVSAIPWGQLL